MPRKIAILGGGIAGLTAAFRLSELDDVEITVYESTCRLGGKGASGRGPGPLQRIEEHGLHLWFGFYENAFAMMRECYAQLEDASMPYRKLEDAFEPQTHAVLAELFEGQWFRWNLNFPNGGGEPGLGSEPPSFFGCVRPLIEMVVQNASGGPIGKVVKDAADEVIAFLEGPLDILPDLAGRKNLLALLRKAMEGMRDTVWVTAQDFLADATVRRGWRLLDTVTACIIALDESNVWGTTLDNLDDQDFLEWIRPHLIDPDIMSRPGRPFEETCPVVRFVYNSAFAFAEGKVDKPELAAGVTLRALFRFIGYPGDAIYRMRGSMGDVVIAPLYGVLRQRNVKFEFFSTVKDLVPAGDAIDTIVVEKAFAAVRGDEYQPLGTDHRGRACWPQAPAGEGLAPPVRVPLTRGTDFHDVVVAIPIDALKEVVGSWGELPANWWSMFDKVRTVATQAFQFWMTETTEALKGTKGGLFGTHVEPVDTECDMTVVLEHEDWDPAKFPQPAKSLAYLCGVLPDTDATSQASADAAVRRNALDYVVNRRDLARVYPGAYDAGGVRWSAFVDTQNRAGAARFDFQYLRANVSPSERYTLSVKGSTGARLRANESGFSNCVLCGDWTRNNYNAGCVEASVVSGLFAARALGARVHITAEDDSWFWEKETTTGGGSISSPPVSSITSVLKTAAAVLGKLGIVSQS